MLPLPALLPAAPRLAAKLTIAQLRASECSSSSLQNSPHVCADSSAKHVAVVERNGLLRPSADFQTARTSVQYLFVVKVKFLRCHRLDLSHSQGFPTSVDYTIVLNGRGGVMNKSKSLITPFFLLFTTIKCLYYYYFFKHRILYLHIRMRITPQPRGFKFKATHISMVSPKTTETS